MRNCTVYSVIWRFVPLSSFLPLLSRCACQIIALQASKKKQSDEHKLEIIRRYLAAVFGAVVLVYLVVFTSAQPSPQLVGATITEATLLVCLLAYRRWQSQKPQSPKVTAALTAIDSNSKGIAIIKSLYTGTSALAMAAALLFVSVDLLALVAANTAHYQIARTLYVVTAPPTWSGLQPAFSLEVLAGACIQSHNFEKAEKLEFENLMIRQVLVGKNHELTASSFCDLGDLYGHFNRPVTAEVYYRKAIELATRINYYRGYGKPMTSLACLLRDQKKYGEAEQSFHKALEIRKKLFGCNSEKYSETLLEYARLLKAEGCDVEARKAQFYSESVRTSLAIKNKNEAMTPLLVSCESLALFTQKDRVILFIAKHMR